jgi:hypothetical protein
MSLPATSVKLITAATTNNEQYKQPLLLPLPAAALLPHGRPTTTTTFNANNYDTYLRPQQPTLALINTPMPTDWQPAGVNLTLWIERRSIAADIAVATTYDASYDLEAQWHATARHG